MNNINKSQQETLIKQFWNKYKITYDKNDKDELGRGAFATVKYCFSNQTQENVAIKIIDKTLTKNAQDLENFQREVSIHQQLRHPNIIQFIEHLETDKNIFIILELAQNGSMFHLLKQNYLITESRAKPLILQISQGLQYLHNLKIIHRDIKLENILLDEENNVKICDFGWSCQTTDKIKQQFCGTVEYLAPEMIKEQPYDNEVDIWALGIVLYELLHGVSPFYAKSRSELLQKICNGNVNYKPDISPIARDLLQRMLQVNPSDRIKLEQISNHPWLTGESMTFQVSCTVSQNSTSIQQVDSPKNTQKPKGINLFGFLQQQQQQQQKLIKSTLTTPNSKYIEGDDDLLLLNYGVPIFQKVQANQPRGLIKTNFNNKDGILFQSLQLNSFKEQNIITNTNNSNINSNNNDIFSNYFYPPTKKTTPNSLSKGYTIVNHNLNNNNNNDNIITLKPLIKTHPTQLPPDFNSDCNIHTDQKSYTAEFSESDVDNDNDYPQTQINNVSEFVINTNIGESIRYAEYKFKQQN